MKFIEDYLSELFGCEVCDVYLDFHSPGSIIPIYTFGEESEKAMSGGRGLIKATQCVLYSNLSEYTYRCLKGEEANKLFEYALGKAE